MLKQHRAPTTGARRRPLAVAAASIALLGGLAACSDDEESTSTTAAPETTAGGSETTMAGGDDMSLAGLCPDTVVIQTDWMPEAEHGFLYNLVGDGYTMDADKAYVTGPLVAGGVDTGVQIQIPVSLSPFGPLCNRIPDVWDCPSIMVGMTPQSLNGPE